MEFIAGLKSLQIELETEFAFTDEQQQFPSGQFFLSKVATLVALRQMPKLDFQLRIRPEHAQREFKFELILAPVNYVIIFMAISSFAFFFLHRSGTLSTIR